MTYGMWLDELIITMVCPSILMEKISITFVHYTNTSKRKVSPYYYILYQFIMTQDNQKLIIKNCAIKVSVAKFIYAKFCKKLLKISSSSVEWLR
jgi:hypothetical protein